MNIKGQEMKTYQIVFVPIGNAKITLKIESHPIEPVLKYHKESSTSCFLSGSASYFNIIGENKAATSLENLIEEALTFQSNIFRIIIYFSNDIMKERLHQIGKQHLRNNLKKWVKKGSFDILNEMSENITLVQLMDIISKYESCYQYSSLRDI